MWIFTHSDELVNSDAIRSIQMEKDCGKISIEASVPRTLGITLGIYSCRTTAEKAFLELIKALVTKEASFYYMKREASEEASGNMKVDDIMCELRRSSK